jgi:hypothetical protein
MGFGCAVRAHLIAGTYDVKSTHPQPADARPSVIHNTTNTTGSFRRPLSIDLALNIFMLEQRSATPPASSTAVALTQPYTWTISSETHHPDSWYPGPFATFASVSVYSYNTQAEALSDFRALFDRFIINQTDPAQHNSISPTFAMFGMLPSRRTTTSIRCSM